MLGQFLWGWKDNFAMLFYAALIVGGLIVFFWGIGAASVGIVRSIGDMIGSRGRLIVFLMFLGIVYLIWSGYSTTSLPDGH